MDRPLSTPCPPRPPSRGRRHRSPRWPCWRRLRWAATTPPSSPTRRTVSPRCPAPMHLPQRCLTDSMGHGPTRSFDGDANGDETGPRTTSRGRPHRVDRARRRRRRCGVEAVTAGVAVRWARRRDRTVTRRGRDGLRLADVLRVPADRLDELIDALDALARSVPYPQRRRDGRDAAAERSRRPARNLRAFEQELRALLTEVRERDGTVEGLVAVGPAARGPHRDRHHRGSAHRSWPTVWRCRPCPSPSRQARSTTPVVGTWDLPGVVRDALAATVRLGSSSSRGSSGSRSPSCPRSWCSPLVSSRSVAVRRRERDGPPG
jgi:hypothetical protein